jgi:hypothetical protein
LIIPPEEWVIPPGELAIPSAEMSDFILHTEENKCIRTEGIPAGTP